MARLAAVAQALLALGPPTSQRPQAGLSVNERPKGPWRVLDHPSAFMHIRRRGSIALGMHLHVWTTSAVAPSVPRVARRGRLADESGFTLVEIMTAAFVLVVGLLGILTMLTRAMATTSQSNERVGATNVARELGEAARGVPYDSATPAALATSIKA